MLVFSLNFFILGIVFEVYEGVVLFCLALSSSPETIKHNLLVFHSIEWSSPSDLFLQKGVLKIFSKFTGEHPCRSAISIKLRSNFIEITLWHGCSPVNLQHTLRNPFLKNTSGWLLLYAVILFCKAPSF